MNRTFRLFLFFLFTLNTVSFADEGMWTFDGLNVEHIKQKYGFKATPEWLAHVMKSSVRLNSGGSGSFVSADGLVLTNHHVAADSLHKISKPGQNYYEDGFHAKSLDQEIKVPDLEINQLVEIVDVTGRVNSVVKPEMTPAEANAARKSEIAAIEKEATEKFGANFRADVVTLYHGEKFHLYRYKKYTDVRVVFSPEFKIAFFGGDPDNFEYPRYDLDMTLFRVYEDGKPAKIENYFKWSKAGAAENELVFVSGNPGSTRRLYTTAALEFLRDHQLPLTLNLLYRRERLFLEFSKRGEEQARQAKKDLFGTQNSRKVTQGKYDGLKDAKLLADKRKAEEELRAKVQADPNLKKYAGAWDEVAKTREEFAKILHDYTYFEQGTGFLTRYFGIARTLVRLADENVKPNKDRLREYQEASRKSLEQQLFSTAPIYQEFEKVKLADSLLYLSEFICAEHPLYALLQQVLDGKSPEDRAAELIAGTKLGDVAERKRLYEGGKAAIEASQDTMILLAKLVDGAARELRKQYEDKVEGPEQEAYPKIAKAIFAIRGTSTYPDATFTPRIAYGQVKGYTKDGKAIPAWTNIGGAFEHEAAHGGKDPWQLPRSWHENKDKLDLNVPFNFVSTADIIGGNSGSPVFNVNAEIVGLIFDGNIDSLIGDYVYDDSLNRAVSVHSSGIVEAMKKVYCAEALAHELQAGQRK